jgi:4-hydroxybenzoate polyprenyltransferase
MMGLAVLVGSFLVTSQFDDLNWLHLLFGFLTGFTFCGVAMVINDYYDRNIDSINEPHRPIPSGTVKPRKLWALPFYFQLWFCFCWFSEYLFCGGRAFDYNCNLFNCGQKKRLTWKLF